MDRFKNLDHFRLMVLEDLKYNAQVNWTTFMVFFPLFFFFLSLTATTPLSLY